MCSIGLTLSVLPIEEIMIGVNKLLTPIVTDIHNVLNQCQQSVNIDDQTIRIEMSSQLTMIAMLFSTLDVNLKTNDSEDVNNSENKGSAQTLQPIYIILEQVLIVIILIKFNSICLTHRFYQFL